VQTRVIATVIFSVLMLWVISTPTLDGRNEASSATFPIVGEAITIVDRVLAGSRPAPPPDNDRDVLEILVLIGGVLIASAGTNVWHRWHESHILTQSRPPVRRRARAAMVFWVPPVAALAGIVLLVVIPASTIRQLATPVTDATRLERMEVYTRSSQYVLFALLGVAACLGIVAGHLHRIANHDRRLKYALALSSVMLLWLASTIYSRQVGLTTVFALMSFHDQVMTAVPIIWHVAAFAALHTICRVATPQRLCFLRWCSVVWAMPLFSISLLRFDGPLVLTVLMFRFCVGERLSARPILYFRSFSDAHASRIFSRIVAPAAAVHGVVVALVHDKQRGSDLQGGIHPMQCATVLAVPEDEWRSWVEHQLSRASAAILDRSVLSKGLEWELEAASAALGDRLIVLESDDTPGPATTERRPRGTGVLVRYPRGRRAERSTRRVLRHVVGRVVGAM
jgi:hypothetical protein